MENQKKVKKALFLSEAKTKKKFEKNIGKRNRFKVYSIYLCTNSV